MPTLKAKSLTLAPLPQLTDQELHSLRQDNRQAGQRARQILTMTTAEQEELKKRILYSPMAPEGLITPHDPNQTGVMTDDPPCYVVKPKQRRP